MKLSEMKHVSEFLSVLFDFFKQYNITSSLEPVRDMDALKRNLLNSKYIRYKYLSNINTFYFDIHYYPELEKDEIYMFLFGGKNEGQGCAALIDLGKKLSFIHVEIDSRKYPPFVRDLLNDKAELMVSYLEGEDRLEHVNESKIMTFDELKRLLAQNNIRQEINWIEVE